MYESLLNVLNFRSANTSSDSVENIQDIGDVLIVRDKSDNKLKVVAFDKSKPYLLSSDQILDN